MRSIWNNFINSGCDSNDLGVELRRFQFVNTFSLIGSSTLFFFGLLYIVNGVYLYGAVELLMALIGLANILLLRVSKNVSIAATAVLIVMSIVLVFLFFGGGVARTGLFWFYLFPPLAFFLKGQIKGAFWVLAQLLLIVCAIVAEFLMIYDFPYTLIELRQLLISLITQSGIIFSYAYFINVDESLLRDQQSQLIDNNQQLLKNVSELSKTQQQLVDSIKTSTDQNKLLEDTKKATLNILEDLQEAKNAIEREKSQDEALLSSIGDGVFAIDSEEKIILFNKAAEEISQFSSSEVLGKKYDQILKFSYKKDGKVNNEFIKNALSGQRAEMANHTQLARKDGKFVPVADSAAPLLTSDKKVEGVVVVFRDVTKEQQLEKMKDEFVSIASHELRTPMTAIKGFISMIKDGDYGKVPAKMTEPLDDIGNSTDRLITLVTDMLNVSRIEAGRLKFTLTTFNTTPVINEVLGTLQPIAKDKKITLKAKALASEDVLADVDKVKQVLNNLIGNSLKFTEKGGIEINSVTDDDVLKIMVSDTGVGISADDQKMLFGKFKQIQSAQNGKPAGTGLGLYLSRELVKKMGGDLWIEKSAPGKGSTFAFSIPLSGSKLAKKIEADLKKEAEIHPDQKSD